MGHPALTGPGYIAPPFLFGKLLRLLGADAVVFANHGGRFGYTPDTCKALAVTALGALGGLEARGSGSGRRHDAGPRPGNAAILWAVM